MTSVERFRVAAGRRDVGGMADALAADVCLNLPTRDRPVAGRERARAIFGVLDGLLEDLEYTRALGGDPVGGTAGIASSHALVFSAKLGEAAIEGVDVLDVDENGEIVAVTIFIRPLAGLEALGAAMRAAFGGPSPPTA
jgi:hypothetical protein